MRVANIHGICIQTSDYEASKAFYCEMLSFEVEKESAGVPWVVIQFRA